MIEQLFGSKTRVKLLRLFLNNPNRQFYVREITRKIEEQINSVRRELSNLLNIGIIISDGNNNKLYYEVNQKYKFYQPLAQIFSKDNIQLNQNSEELPGNGEIASNDDLNSIGHVELAILTGQFTRDETSGVDILIVGDVNPNAVAKYVNQLESKENKSLRYSILNKDDFMYRLEVRDRFANSILNSKKQVLIDLQGIIVKNSEENKE